MSKITCPNTSSPSWLNMVKEFGTREAYRAFLMDIHDPVEYKKLSDIKLGGWQTYTAPVTSDFGQLAATISAKATELKSQGAQIRSMNERGFQYLLPVQLSVNLSDENRLTNIGFPIDGMGRRAYTGILGDSVSSLRENKKVVWDPGLLSSLPNAGSQLSLHREQGVVNNGENGGGLHNTGREGIWNKVPEQLFNTYRQTGDKQALSGLAYSIASRLLQKDDNFIGRVGDSLFSNKGGLGEYRIHLEDRQDRNPLYAYTDGIHINIGTLGKFVDKFETANDFQQAVEVSLIEEVIHSVMFATSSIDEINNVGKELLSTGLSKYVENIYNFPKGSTIDHLAGEYLRMIIQGKNFGTITELHIKAPSFVEMVRRAIKYLLNLFNDKPTGTAKVVIDRMQSFIDGTKSNVNYQLTNNKDLQYELQSIINKAVSGRLQESTIGTALSVIRNYKENGSGSQGNGQEDGIWGTIQKSGLEYTKNLGEINEKGGEHRVYNGNTPNTVIKTRYGMTSTEEIDYYLRKLLIYNHLFPSVAYKLLGFTKQANEILPVVEQQAIIRDNYYNQDTITKSLALYGFNKVSDEEYYNKDLDITISDIKARNVFFKKGIPYFIDPVLTVDFLLLHGRAPVEAPGYITNPANKQLNSKITKFLTNLGVSVEKVDQILTDSGQSANAMVDTINKVIRVVQDKEQVDTLGHEATHLFLDLLPDSSVLLRDVLRDVRTRDEYSVAIDEYGKLPEYQDADGNVNEEKIAKEAAADVIGKVIAGTITDKKAKSLWQRVWDYIRKLFKGVTELSPYEQVASDILSGDVSKLDTNRSGNGIHYQLSEDEERTAREAFKRANPLQAKIIEEVYFEPHTRLMLEPTSHTYIDSDGVTYTSVTTAIGQDFPEAMKDDYEDNRNWGNDVDAIMQGIILRKPMREIATSYISEEVKQDVHDILREYYGQLTADGSVVLPQVIVADKESGIAGSIDILTIDPYGNMKVVDIKSSVHALTSSSFRNFYPLKADSRIVQATANTKSPVKAMNKLQVHGTQVGVYGKLLELQGWFIATEGLVTKHIQLHVKEGAVTGATDNGIKVRNDSDNATTVDAIVPTAYTNKDRLQELNEEFNIGNPLRSKKFQDEHTPIPENIEELLAAKIDTAAEAISKFEDYLNDLRHVSNRRLVKDAAGKVVDEIAKFEARDRFVNRMNDLYKLMSTALTHDTQVAAYDEFLNFTYEEVSKISKYLTAMKEVAPGEFVPKNIDDPNYIHTATLAKRYIDTFHGIMDLQVFGTSAQAALLSKVVQKINDTNKDITFATKEHLIQLGKGYTSREGFTREDVDKVLTRDKDVSNNELNFGTIGNSGVFLIENTAKYIKDNMLAAKERAEHITEKFIPIAEKLRIASGGKITATMYDFMLRRDREGKLMGSIVSQVGREYRALQEKVYNALLDSSGKPLEYREISDPVTASAEDKQFNIDLWYKKQARLEFERAEVIDEKGNVETGEYHRYTDEFLNERDKYMYKEEYFVGSAGPFYRWEFKGSKSKEQEDAIITFKRKYFKEIPEYLKMEMVKGEPTGIVTEQYGLWVVKGDYITVRDTEKSSGKPIADPEYMKLMHPTTELGRVQKEFYESYTDIMGQIMDMLPASASETFKKGGIPTLGASWVQLLANGTYNMQVLMTNAIQAQFSTPVEIAKDIAANTGSSRQSIPLTYVTPLQSQLQLDKIAQERKDLLILQGKLSEHEYAEKLAHLDNLEKKERGKMKAADLHPDLALGLKEMIKAATQFQAKSDMEDTLIAVGSQLANMEYEQEVRRFGIKTGSQIVKGEQSNAYKRWMGFMDMCFYHDPLMNRSTADAVVKKLMGVTSALGVGFNIFGWGNNLVTGSINNFLDSIGGDFWNRKAMRRMQKEFVSKAAPGYMRTIMEHKVKGATYEEKKAGSKFEWIADHFHAIEHYQAEIRGQFSWFSKIGAYSGMEAGEYMMQSVVANAILDSVMIKNSITGEESSVYNAYDWSAKDGKGGLKKGFELSDKEKHLITVRIRETIDRIHGNYSPENKTMFERYWWGTIMMQFHKWVWPNFKQRVQPGKYDENLGGGMDIEGRYRTLWGFVSKLHSLADLTSGNAWNRLTDHQKHNMQKDLADAVILAVLFGLIHVMKSIADGIPDDDPNLKRWVHWLQQQSDRSFQEVSLFTPLGPAEGYQIIKSPIAGAGSIRQFAELLQSSYRYPFIDDEHRYYQRGPYKGMSHLQKDLNDVIPIMYEWNRIKSLENITSFYIK